jgi:arginyl-tRNA synthetase
LYRFLERRLAAAVRAYLKRAYNLELPKIVIEQPPKVELGEYAMPLAFELARQLRKAPRKIADEIVAGIGPIEGIEKLEVAGAGYINARVNRAAVAAALAANEHPEAVTQPGKILVEHSSINPNKAAHIGHLRNAILGDTFVRLLRYAGREVDIQNYIDNTGVQVADVVVGFLYIEKKSRAEIEALAAQHRFDYYCWDLYARVSQWYEQDKQNLQIRLKTLHEIEAGGNETAGIADLISVAVLRRHLETMDRLDIEYDFLPRESEILHLHFWDAAFAKLKESGVLFFETEGKNKGCWVMRRAGTGKGSLNIEAAEGKEKRKIGESAKQSALPKLNLADLRIDTYASGPAAVRVTHLPTGIAVIVDTEKSHDQNRAQALVLLQEKISDRLRDGEVDDQLRVIEPLEGVDIRKPNDDVSEEDQKVIVRSNGTVGYVGKDIAYHMWKFGLLGRDFFYRIFYKYPNNHLCWVSTDEAHGEHNHPHFGDVAEIYNVIDARQSEAQNTVIEALRGLGHDEAADHYTHFSYEMVALTPRCAADLGYTLSEEDKARSYIEVSGRKGFGVKADDLLDRLIASARAEEDTRHPELSEEERNTIATQIAVGALRYFMLKYTKQSVIAFDFKDALSFEGETGPYAQYAVVRANSIFRKAGLDPETYSTNLPAQEFSKYLDGADANDLWEIWLGAAKTAFIVDQCIATTEPAYLAKHAFQLAQQFAAFYHRHRILDEPDEGRKQFLLATTAVVRRELIRTLAVLGISAPAVM